jgi:hypothetical protein
VNVVDAVAVEAVLEASGVCADLDRARAVLVEALASAKAPRRGGGPRRGDRWTLSVRVSRAPGNTKAADASILDDAGAVVSQRTLADRGGCTTIARGIGAWATLVIDAELNRAHDEPEAPAPAPGAPREGLGAVPPGAEQAALPRGDADHAPLPVRGGNIEVGGAVYFRGGGAGGGIVGLAPFVVVEVSSGWLVRPSLAFGSTKGPSGTNPAHLGARFDFCRRIPGNYIERRGLEADLCAGADGGVITSEIPAALMSVGPAMALRGDLGAGLMLELRGGVGANLLDAAEVATRSAVTGDAQIGVSGRLP